MDYRTASQYEVPFGKYKDRTLDDIAQTDAGLLYLDWLRGELDKKCNRTDETLRDALRAYLDDTTITNELRKLIDSGKGYR
jgi:hypothetical protein